MLGYRNARNLADAIALLTDLPNWRPVCGGTDLLVQLPMGRLQVDGFVNLWGLLPRHINEGKHEIAIGAGVTCTELSRHSGISRSLLPLWEAARTMGSPQVRNRASLGGNVCNASPAADMGATLLLEDARAVIRNATGEYDVPLTQFWNGPGQTLLQPGDVLVELIVPRPPPHSYSRFDKLGFRQAQIISAANFSIRLTGQAGGVDQVRIVWGSVAPTPVRSHAVEGILMGTSLTDRNIQTAVDNIDADIAPIDDHRASAAYRTAVARSFLHRALKECQAWLSS